MDSEDGTGRAGIILCNRNARILEMRIDMKKYLIIAVMCVLFMVMGTQALAKDNDITQWISEELQKEENKELAEKIIDFIREKLEEGELENDEDISTAIEEGEDKFNVRLTEDEKDKILQSIQKIKELGLDPEKFLDQASEICDDAKQELITETEKKVKTSFVNSVTGFFHDMGSRVKDFFTGVLF